MLLLIFHTVILFSAFHGIEHCDIIFNCIIWSFQIRYYDIILYHIISCHFNLCGVVCYVVTSCLSFALTQSFSSLSLFILLSYHISIYLILNYICSTFKFSRIILINIFLSFRVNILLFYLIIKSYIGRCGNCV